MKRTGKTSAIKRKLPPELRKVLDELLAGNRHTLDEVVAHMRAMGASVSRSAVGRYSQELDTLAADIRQAREMAQAVGRELADVEGDSGRLAIESLQALLLRRLATGEAPDPKEIQRMAQAVRDLQTALKSNIETEIKIRERALKEAARAAAEVASEQGLSEATVEAIKRRILGVS